MKKSTVIATCLVNLHTGIDMSQGEFIVRNTFIDYYPSDDFDAWNSELPDQVAKNIISNVGNASQIKVAKFIEDLWG
ncbi:hypothetical protein ACFQUU_08590 [Herbaspirillum sp. GCM10030257]|uniref:hypothetical protein n=1 Tax=Herbaspirillum sp. GCM10030257 TaxID=3273393 RepID=UPI003623E895